MHSSAVLLATETEAPGEPLSQKARTGENSMENQDGTGTQTPPTPDDSRFSTVPLTAQWTEWSKNHETIDVHLHGSPPDSHHRNPSQGSTLAIRARSPGFTHTTNNDLDSSSPLLLDRALLIQGNSMIGTELRSPLQNRFSDLQLECANNPDDSEDIDWGASTSLLKISLVNTFSRILGCCNGGFVHL
jgi:hypothetical protein